MNLSFLASESAQLMLGSAAVVLIVIVVLMRLLRRKQNQPVSRGQANARALDAVDTITGWPPQPTRVMTQGERKAYALLVDALPECMVFAQVPLARFLKVPTRYSYAEWLRRVGHLCADLVVCDPHSQVLAVVQVRSGSESESDRSMRRHERIRKVLKAAGLEVHVWRDGALPMALVVREMLLKTPGALTTGEGAATISTHASVQPPSPQQIKNRLGIEIPDEVVEWREPPPTTWFDEFSESAPGDLPKGAKP